MADTSMGAYSDPNTTPPIGQAIPLGAQHVLAMFASNVTPSIIVAGAAGLAFGGPERKTLYVATGDSIWKRPTQLIGARPWREPVKPPRPRL